MVFSFQILLNSLWSCKDVVKFGLIWLIKMFLFRRAFILDQTKQHPGSKSAQGLVLERKERETGGDCSTNRTLFHIRPCFHGICSQGDLASIVSRINI